MAGRTALTAWQEATIAVALVAVAAAVSWSLSAWLSAPSLALVFLLAVAISGGYLGLRSALIASVVGFVACNFLFTEPRFTLAVAKVDDFTSLIAFLLVSVIVGHLASQLRDRAAEAQRSAERVTTLFDFSRRMATTVDEHDLLEAASRGIGEILGCRSVVLAASPDGRLAVPLELGRERLLDELDLGAAHRALAEDESVAGHAAAAPDTAWRFEPVGAGGEVLGVLGVRVRGAAWEPGAEEERLLFALRMQLASAWQRHRLQQAANDARLDQAASRLRSALLASVSHDLRTPLVSIIGSLSALRDPDVRLSPQDRATLTQTALAEAERLNRLVQNLLDMTRLSYGALQPRIEAISVAEAVDESLRRLESLYAERPVDVRVEPSLPCVRADRTLLQQVLVNLLDNAAKYSSGTEPVSIVARCADGQVLIAVTDRGPGIPSDVGDKVFDLFYRARQGGDTVSGHGLGLPICRGFVEAMQGRIETGPGPDSHGTTMTVSLPAVDAATTPAPVPA